MSEKKDDPYRIYVDLEYMYPGMTREKGRPTASETRQIVQISAILFDAEQGEELRALDVLTFPEYSQNLPDFFVELTGIGQETLREKGGSLSEGLSAFEAFASEYPIYTFNLDEEVFRQNYGYLNRPFPFPEPFIRVRSLLPGWGIDPDQYSSGTLFRAARLSLRGHVHNALHDVRSMALAVHAFESGSVGSRYTRGQVHF